VLPGIAFSPKGLKDEARNPKHHSREGWAGDRPHAGSRPAKSSSFADERQAEPELYPSFAMARLSSVSSKKSSFFCMA
jgi:hypothetical protein